MPIITVQMLEGRSLEQKRELVEALTREMARICGCSEAGIFVVIEESQYENFGVGGKLCADLYPKK